MRTPWGTSDYEHKYAEGVTFYGTPSHGGFHVSSDRVRKIPVCLQGLSGYPVNWYEEDCAWAVVAYVFPEVFVNPESKDPTFHEEGSVKEYAKGVLTRWYPNEIAQAIREEV